MTSKLKYTKYLSVLVLVAFAFIASSSNFAVASSAAGCNLTKIHISAGTMAANTETVIITATPSCWSGAVQVNQGNQDHNMITVNVVAGHGTGVVQRQETSGSCAQFCIHPYATNPGMRGNNILVPAN
jgi:hypothetical protein